MLENGLYIETEFKLYHHYPQSIHFWRSKFGESLWVFFLEFQSPFVTLSMGQYVELHINDCQRDYAWR